MKKLGRSWICNTCGWTKLYWALLNIYECPCCGSDNIEYDEIEVKE